MMVAADHKTVTISSSQLYYVALLLPFINQEHIMGGQKYKTKNIKKYKHKISNQNDFWLDMTPSISHHQQRQLLVM